MDPVKTKEAHDKAREMFLDDPSQSIDSVASALDRMKRGIPRSELSRIRTEVRMKIAAGGTNPRSPVLAMSPEMARKVGPLVRRHGLPVQPSAPPTVSVKTAQPSGPFNPPRLEKPTVQPVVQAESEKVVPSQTVATVPGSDQTPGPAQQEGTILAKSTQDERFKWLQDWLLDNVETASVSKAREAMLKKFGPGNAFGSQTVNELLKTAREAAGLKPRLSVAAKAAATRGQLTAPPRPIATPEVHGVLPIRRGPPSMEEAIRSIVGIMRSGGIQKVELVGDEVKVLRTQPQEFAFKVT